MTEQEKIELFDKLIIGWDFGNNDLPTLTVGYIGEKSKLYVLKIEHGNTGVLKVGEAYRECMQNYGDKSEQEFTAFLKHLDELIAKQNGGDNHNDTARSED